MHLIPPCYFTKHCHTLSMPLHGFSEASEVAYAEVVYLRTVHTGASNWLDVDIESRLIMSALDLHSMKVDCK